MIVLGFKKDKTYREVCHVEERKYNPQEAESFCEDLYRMIDCETFDVVDIGHGIDMFVDDEGPNNNNRHKLNHLATYLRTKHWLDSKKILFPSSYPPVVGTAVLFSTDEEGRTIDLLPEQVEYVKQVLNLPNSCIEIGET